MECLLEVVVDEYRLIVGIHYSTHFSRSLSLSLLQHVLTVKVTDTEVMAAGDTEDTEVTEEDTAEVTTMTTGTNCKCLRRRSSPTYMNRVSSFDERR
jgi:hypothetical protein